MTDVTRSRANQIDSLRTFSVAAVIFSHTIPETYRIGAYKFYDFGSYGVYMFFVISAFLITSQLIATKRDWKARGDSIVAPLTSFYAKRALRLMPAYYLVLFGLLAFKVGTIGDEWKWHTIMASNILFGLRPFFENASPVGHFWSLSMEWQFYLVWPFLVLLLSERLLLGVTMAILAFSAASWAELMPLNTKFAATAIPASLDSLAFGALLAIGSHRGWPLRKWLWLGWPAAVVVLVGVSVAVFGRDVPSSMVQAITHEAMNFAFAALVLGATSGFGGLWGRVLDNSWLRYLGLISYGIYLYHQILIDQYYVLFENLGMEQPIPDGILLTIPVFVLSVGVASLSWHFFELPINRFRHRFAYTARRDLHGDPVPNAEQEAGQGTGISAEPARAVHPVA